MICPRCATRLERVDLGEFAGEYPDVTIDRCPACRGAWYDKGELDLSDESPWTNVEELPLQHVAEAAIIPCPRCGTSMTPVTVQRLSELVLDRCPTCAGFWLDAGELPALQAYVARLDSGKMASMSHVPQPRRVVGADGAELLLFVVGDDGGDNGDGD